LTIDAFEDGYALRKLARLARQLIQLPATHSRVLLSKEVIIGILL
jgi:hypothetical protein